MEKMSLRTYHQKSAAGRRRPRIKSHRINTEDGRFDSKAEYERWCELKLLLAAGEIEDLRRQVPFPITINGKRICTYLADYTYTWTRSREAIVEDCKGHRTDIYKLKKKLVEAAWSIRILETPAGKMARNRRVW